MCVFFQFYELYEQQFKQELRNFVNLKNDKNDKKIKQVDKVLQWCKKEISVLKVYISIQMAGGSEHVSIRFINQHRDNIIINNEIDFKSKNPRKFSDNRPRDLIVLILHNLPEECASPHTKHARRFIYSLFVCLCR